MTNINKETLKAFTEYCEANPDQRFGQAFTNFICKYLEVKDKDIGYRFVIISNVSPDKLEVKVSEKGENDKCIDIWELN